MQTQDDFVDLYKKLTHTQLLEIIENPDDYQVVAVGAAKNELASRQLSKEEIDNAIQPVLVKRQELEQKSEKARLREKKIKDAGNVLFESINPVQKEIPSAEKLVRMIAAFYTATFIYYCFSSYRTLRWMILYLPDSPFYNSYYIVTVFIIPSGAFFLWRKKTAGWILLMIYCIHTLGILAISAWDYFTRKPPTVDGFEINYFDPGMNLTTIFLLLFLISSTAFVLCKKEIREIFKINKEKILLTGIIGVILFFLHFL